MNSPVETDRAVTDYSKLKVVELKALLDERGIVYDLGALKADLIRLLEEADG